MASVEKSGLVVSVAFLLAYGYIPLLAYSFELASITISCGISILFHSPYYTLPPPMQKHISLHRSYLKQNFDRVS